MPRTVKHAPMPQPLKLNAVQAEELLSLLKESYQAVRWPNPVTAETTCKKLQNLTIELFDVDLTSIMNSPVQEFPIDEFIGQLIDIIEDMLGDCCVDLKNPEREADISAHEIEPGEAAVIYGQDYNRFEEILRTFLTDNADECVKLSKDDVYTVIRDLTDSLGELFLERDIAVPVRLNITKMQDWLYKTFENWQMLYDN